MIISNQSIWQKQNGLSNSKIVRVSYVTAAPVNHWVSNLLFSQCSSDSKIGVNDAHYKGTIESIIILFKVACHIRLKKRRQVSKTFVLFSHFVSVLASPVITATVFVAEMEAPVSVGVEDDKYCKASPLFTVTESTRVVPPCVILTWVSSSIPATTATKQYQYTLQNDTIQRN